ncbi:MULTISPECIES: hypothetical protein [unclassified Paenibacillus]|uniref:hypothetical protein n=1 Tax=unclassified Paenibacillus TaxID=185978 RepID=UPI00362DBB3A
MAFEKELPEWKSPGVEPSASKKNEGWKPGEKPPADWLNWTQNRTYKALEELQNHKHTGAVGDAAKLDSNSLANGAATDAVIGNRTVDDTVVPSTGPNTITGLFGSLGKMIRQVTGKSSWITPPATTLEAANTHMNATSGVHGAVSAATPNTLLVRDANGRAQVAAPVAAADIARKDTVDALEVKLKATQSLTTNLNYGLQTVNADQAGPIDLSARGRTLVNLLGRDGNFEMDSNGDGIADGFSVLSVSGTSLFSLSPDAKFGTKSQKLASSGYSNIKKDLVNIDSSKTYLISVWMKVDNGGSVEFRLYKDSTSYISPGTVTTQGYQLKYLKFAGSYFNGGTEKSLRLYQHTSFAAYFDGISIYEISAADYAKIDDDPEFTGDKLAAKFPYTESIANVNGLYVTKSGKNLLPPFNEWTLHANSVVVEPYKLTLNATAQYQSSTSTIPALPSQTYTLTMSTTQSVSIYAFDKDDVSLSTIYNQMYNGAITFTTPPNTAKFSVNLFNHSATGTFTFTSPMLNLGSIAAPFEPKSDQYIYVPNQQLASNVDGSVYDMLYKMGNKYYKETRFKRMDLTGSLAWSYTKRTAGHVALYTPITNNLAGNSFTAVKYDGKIVKFDNSLMNPDVATIDNVNGSFYVTAPSSDTGWGEDYTPTQAEIKAYFYGWRMYDGVNPANLYTGGTKYWYYIDASGNPFGGTDVLPTTLAPQSDKGRKPYKLQYQLATSTIEEIAVEGDIALHEGGNQIEVGSGIIVREKANPQLVAGTYKINDGNTPLTLLKYRSLDILSVNKGLLQAKGSKIYDSFYKLHRYEVTSADYDPTADYYVTYIALDQYNITCSPTDVSILYGANMATVVSNLAQDLAGNTTKDSVQDWLLLQDGAYLDNLRIDIDTHRNASTAHGSTSAATASTIMQRDANGRAQVAVPVAAADIARKDTVDAVDSKLKTTQLLTTNLNYGLQAINADQVGPVDLGVRGRTLVNLLGRDGNFESLTPWTIGASASLSSVNKTIGNYCVYINNTNNYVYKDYANLNSASYYVLIGDLKSDDANFCLNYWDYGAFTNIKRAYSIANGKFNAAYLKFTGKTGIRISVGAHQGSTAMNGYADGLRLYEITAAEYAAIDSMTLEQIATKFPYTEGIANVNGLYVTKSGKNLIPVFNEWTLNANAVVNEPYKLTINKTTGFQEYSVLLRCLPSQIYTMSWAQAGTQWAVNFYSDEAGLTFISSFGYTASLSGTFTTPSNAKSMKVYPDTNSAAGTYIFDKPILNLGSTALPFEPKSDQYIYIPNQQFASSTNGAIYDSLYKAGSKYYKESRLKTIDLKDTLSWSGQNDYVGYKQVYTAGNSFADTVGSIVSNPTVTVLDYKGQPVSIQTYIHNLDNRLYVYVADLDSGWGETYNPSAADIASYFKGWRLSDNAFGQYSSGTKYYTAVDALKANFLNKVSGSVVGNPHTSKYGKASSLITPSGSWTGEVSTSSYTWLQSLDGQLELMTDSVSGNQVQYLFSFNLIEHVIRNYGVEIFGTAITTTDRVTWLKANIGKLTCNWCGFGSSPLGNKAYLSVWKVTTNAWPTAKTHTNSTVTQLSFQHTFATSVVGDLIDSAGFVHYIAYADPSNGTIASTLNTDFVELDVQLLVQTLPNTTYATKNYTPYKLQYQLATSKIEEIAVEGDIALHEGGNQIDVGSGMIVREKVTPLIASAEGFYKINDNYAVAVGSSTYLKNRASRILKVFKNGIEDKKWRFMHDSNVGWTNGTSRAFIPITDYDPTADYYVTYIALDQYNITCNPTDVSIQYGANMATVVSNLAQDLADNTTKDSVQDWLLLQDGAYLDNLRLDVDTHRNTATAHGSTSAATANAIMQRDVNGRAQVAAPVAAADIARKDTVDAVRTDNTKPLVVEVRTSDPVSPVVGQEWLRSDL